jgi:flagellar export protein FliJ
MDGLKLQNYRSFIDRLGEAIRQHVTKLDTARVEYERRRVLWSEKRIEAESLSRVIDRFRKEELHLAERREQREGDDFATRLSIDRAEANKLN